MRYSNRLFLYAPFVVLLIIAGVAALHWRQVATDWQTRLAVANGGHEIAPGVTLQFTSDHIGGFPFNLDIVLEKFVIAVRSTRGPISLASEHFAIHALTYGRAQQVMEAAGVQTVTWTDAEGEMHRFAFVPGSLRASAIERDGRLARFDLDLDALRSSSVVGGHMQFHIRTAPGRDALDFAISADALGYRSSRSAALPHFDIQGRVLPAAPFSSLLSGHDEWRRALLDWRSSNGSMQLDNMDFDWGAAHLSGSGALTLDDAHRISGDVRMQLSGAREWKPTRLAEVAFTSALQALARTMPQPHSSPLPLTLDIRNGAAIVAARGKSRAAGALDPVF